MHERLIPQNREVAREPYGSTVMLQFFPDGGIVEHLQESGVAYNPAQREIIQAQAKEAYQKYQDWLNKGKPAVLELETRCLNSGMIVRRDGKILVVRKVYDNGGRFALDLPAGGSRQVEKPNPTETALREALGEEAVLVCPPARAVVLIEGYEELVRHNIGENLEVALDCGLQLPREVIEILQGVYDGSVNSIVVPLAGDPEEQQEIAIFDPDGDTVWHGFGLLFIHPQGGDVLFEVDLSVADLELTPVDLEVLKMDNGGMKALQPLARDHLWLSWEELRILCEGGSVETELVQPFGVEHITIDPNTHPFSSLLGEAVRSRVV